MRECWSDVIYRICFSNLRDHRQKFNLNTDSFISIFQTNIQNLSRSLNSVFQNSNETLNLPGNMDFQRDLFDPGAIKVAINFGVSKIGGYVCVAATDKK